MNKTTIELFVALGTVLYLAGNPLVGLASQGQTDAHWLDVHQAKPRKLDLVIREKFCGDDVENCKADRVAEKNCSDYVLVRYQLDGQVYGNVVALLYKKDGSQRLVKSFNEGEPNGEVLKAAIRTINAEDYLEIYSANSHGNGTLDLYELRNGELKRIFQTRAVDWHDDGAYYDNGILYATYPDLNGDGHFDIVLEGTVLIDPQESGKVTARKECRRTTIWDRKSEKFVESKGSEINANLCADR